MRTRRIAIAIALVAPSARAQDLPPPPPPPIGQGELAPLPAPPRPPHAEPAPPSPRPPPPTGRPPRRREVVYAYEEAPSYPLAITVNPLGLVLGRVSANVELLVAPHHSLVLSPSLIAFQEGRGGRYDLRSEALGFVSKDSDTAGVELGYHYWWRWRRSLVGPYFGPSLLLGVVTNATVGTTNPQAYWGGAFDAGGQGVLPGGLTLGAGIGLGFLSASSAYAVFPRFLLQLGWSF